MADADELTDVAVIIVNYASSALTRVAAAPLRTAGLRVVVVDNRSTDGERTAIRRLGDELALDVVEEENLGFGPGMNVGVRTAAGLGARVAILLNPDARMTPDAATALARRARGDDQPLVAPVVLNGSGGVWSAGGTLDRAAGATRTHLDASGDRDWLSGACLAFRIDAWDAVGGFDGDYFMYWEDVDLSARWAASGRPLEVLPLTIDHDIGGTQGAGKSPLYVYYNCRNRLLFAARNLPASDDRAWRRSTFAYARKVVLRGDVAPSSGTRCD